MLHTKALYNSFRICSQDWEEKDVEAWCLEDLRLIELEELFQRLEKMGIFLNKLSFVNYAEEVESPEELAELVLDGISEIKKYDQGYLTLFEIWRRLLPEKQTISIFCDELDRRIELYDQGLLESDEPIQDALANLVEVLEENIDAGATPSDIFKSLSEYLAHDLESFLYDYISEVLDEENLLYGEELLEDFSPYVSEPDRFAFLEARLVSYTNIREANDLVEGLLKKKLDATFLLDILKFLSTSGDRSLFLTTVKKISPLIQTQDDLYEVLSVAAEYYSRLDEDRLEDAILNLMTKVKESDSPVSSKDSHLREFLKLLMPSATYRTASG